MDNRNAIAIVGMSCRFPGAPDVRTFWANLCSGTESIRRFSDEELEAAGVSERLRRDPAYVPVNGVLDGIDGFDAAFFDITPRDVEIMDPQHRLFLECAWEALEAGGYRPGRESGRVGIYGGSGASTYLINNLLPRADVLERVGSLELLMANTKDYVPTRVAYKLDLSGPALNTNTACSTGLVNVHLACQGLLSFECDMALAGGVSIQVPQDRGYLYEPDAILSPDGHCRAFDAKAAGTVSGNGAGVVLLKRLDEAIADGDHIHAVILATAINNDGAAKAGFTAPSVSGQADVISQALATADVPVDSIGYVETHGTGTPVGDPIEIHALTEAFRARTQAIASCAIGSVKTNFGHLDEAAGIAGLIKTALALEHGMLPPSLHCDTPNPLLQLESSPFHVNAELRAWPAAAHPRRAGVSSFGLGGTNAHAVLEQPPGADTATSDSPRQVLILSAKTTTALQTAELRLADAIEQSPNLALADVAFTLWAGRKRFAHRAVFSVLDREDAVRTLRGAHRDRSARHSGADGPPQVVFMFPGSGLATVGMARSIYDCERAFRECLDTSAALLRPHIGLDIREVIFADADRLQDAAFAQPAMFAVEYALARQWRAWGVEPAAMIGHSAGEYVAACLAGTFTLEDGLHIMAERGKIIAAAPAGATIAITLDEDALRRRLPAGLDIAGVSAPGLCVVSGPPLLVDRFRAGLEQDGVDCRRVDINFAAHSSLMDDAANELKRRVERLTLAAPRLRFVSNVTGNWITVADATAPEYWARHLRQTVRFSDGIETICKSVDQPVFLEVGPGRSLTAPVLRHPARRDHAVIPSMRHAADQADDHATLNLALGRLWAAGLEIDTARVFDGRPRRRVPLPTYPFERKRFWIDAVSATASSARRANVADWLHLPSWRRSLIASTETVAPAHVAIIGTGHRLTDRCGVLLRELGHRVESFGTADATRAAIGGADLILDFTGLEGEGSAEQRFAGLLAIAKVLAERPVDQPASLLVVTSAAMQVTDADAIDPAKASVFGLVHSLEQEFPHIRCRALDIDTNAVAEPVVAEALHGNDRFVALRGHQRWCREFTGAVASTAAPPLRTGGAYIITGGIGDVGATMARALARAARARLILVTRSRELDPALRAELEGAGAAIIVRHADVADEDAMRAVLDDVTARFGRIAGVIHAAGITAAETIFRPIGETDLDQVRDLFRPKVAGTLVLERLLRGRDLDFCLLISSNASTLGGLGLSAYGAASHVLDAIAARCRQAGMPWTSSNWDGWPSATVAESGRRQSGIEAYAMSATQAEEAFLRVLSCGTERIVVSAGDLGARTRRWTAGTKGAADIVGDVRAIEGSSNATEVAVLTAVADLLGTSPRTVDDNFFELGGDSLLGSRMMARLSRQFGVPLSVRMIFTDPTISGIASQIDAACGRGGETLQPIVRLPDAATYALSSTARRLWILHEIDRASAAYHVALHQMVEGPLDVAALRKALAGLAERHESLRTTFEEIEGEPRQVVHRAMTIPLEMHDVAPAADPEASARRLARSHSMAPFDLATGPLVRSALIRLDPDRHVLLFTMHHIVSDGVSVAVIGRDLSRLYDAARSGTAPALPPLSIHYRDFAAWQNARLEGDLGTAARDYWHRQLGGPLPVLDLVEDFARPGVLSTNGREHLVAISAEITAGLTNVGQRRHASLFMVLLAALKTLLYRYSGQDDIIVGTPSAGRVHPDLDEQVGCFLNTLALRDRVDPVEPFAAFVDRVRVTAADAFDHQEYPFERLVSELQLPRNASRSPVFDVMMILQNDIDNSLAIDGLRAQSFADHNGTARLDLSFNFKPSDDGLILGIEYNTDLFLPERIVAMADQFQALLRAIGEDPSQSIGTLAVMPDTQRRLILETFNGTKAVLPEARSLIDLFEARVAAHPHADAARHLDRSMSFRDLDRRATQLAGYLASRTSLGAGGLAIIAVPSGFDLLISLVATLKLRAAAVLVESSIAPERLANLANHSRALAIVCAERPASLSASCPVIALDAERDAVEQSAAAPNTGLRSIEDDVLVFFTSGSTGAPKGVRLTNRGLINELDWFARYFAMTPRDVLPQKTVLTFVDSVVELLLPLTITGGAVALRPDCSITSDLARLGRWFADCGATIAQFVPEVFEEFAADVDVNALAGLRALVLSGAAVTRQRRYPFAVYNLYGCSETTALATACDITEPAITARVPIGKPLQNTRVYILDSRLSPVPLFTPGEIFIGGDPVAAGYLNDPANTAERFIANPFGPGTLFRTGDFGRWYADGTIDYLGRRDDQAKIRGQRIDGGAVEHAVANHPGVREAAVVVRDVAGQPSLVAYVAGDLQTVDRERMRAYLSATLPDHMIPSFYVRVDALPRTSSGKVDRKSLPDPQPAVRTSSVTLPRTPIEESIAAIWRDVLDIDAVSVDDDFLALGGHSLKATRVASRMIRDLGLNVTVTDVFRHPTIAALAEAAVRRSTPIEGLRAATDADSIAPMTAAERELLG